ncbi:MAG: SHOCT domain-containing protein [Myxococcota bacterium]
MSSHLETLKRVLDGNYEDASEAEKAQAVRELIQVCSVAAGAMTVQPIPFVDTALIAPIQIGLVQGIGKIHGHSLDRKSILEILGTFGASIVAQNLIMAAAKLIPFFGWLVTISMAYALTWAIGEVSDHYFRNDRKVDEAELKAMFERIYKSKKDEKSKEHKRDESLKSKLEQLKEARKSGLLTDEEFEAKKAALLADF